MAFENVTMSGSGTYKVKKRSLYKRVLRFLNMQSDARRTEKLLNVVDGVRAALDIGVLGIALTAAKSALLAITVVEVLISSIVCMIVLKSVISREARIEKDAMRLFIALVSIAAAVVIAIGYSVITFVNQENMGNLLVLVGVAMIAGTFGVSRALTGYSPKTADDDDDDDDDEFEARTPERLFHPPQSVRESRAPSVSP